MEEMNDTENRVTVSKLTEVMVSHFMERMMMSLQMMIIKMILINLQMIMTLKEKERFLIILIKRKMSRKLLTLSETELLMLKRLS